MIDGMYDVGYATEDRNGDHIADNVPPDPWGGRGWGYGVEGQDNIINDALQPGGNGGVSGAPVCRPGYNDTNCIDNNPYVYSLEEQIPTGGEDFAYMLAEIGSAYLVEYAVEMPAHLPVPYNPFGTLIAVQRAGRICEEEGFSATECAAFTSTLVEINALGDITGFGAAVALAYWSGEPGMHQLAPVIAPLAARRIERAFGEDLYEHNLEWFDEQEQAYQETLDLNNRYPFDVAPASSLSAGTMSVYGMVPMFGVGFPSIPD
jgi:hypothetical protein